MFFQSVIKNDTALQSCICNLTGPSVHPLLSYPPISCTQAVKCDTPEPLLRCCTYLIAKRFVTEAWFVSLPSPVDWAHFPEIGNFLFCECHIKPLLILQIQQTSSHNLSMFSLHYRVWTTPWEWSTWWDWWWVTLRWRLKDQTSVLRCLCVMSKQVPDGGSDDEGALGVHTGILNTLRDWRFFKYHIGTDDVYFLVRLRPISSGSSSSSWVTRTWISAPSCSALGIVIFTETGGQFASNAFCFLQLHVCSDVSLWFTPFTGTLRLSALSGKTGIFRFRSGVTGALVSQVSVFAQIYHFSLNFAFLPCLCSYMKACVHTAGGDECDSIESRVAGLPHVSCSVWGTVWFRLITFYSSSW